MSMILYNKQPFNVVLHDPSQNRIIIHNEDTHQFQLVQLSKDLADFSIHEQKSGSQNFNGHSAFSKFNHNHQSSRILCPNCGFDLSNNNTSTNGDSAVFASEGGIYIHSDYFRLLSNYHHNHKPYSSVPNPSRGYSLPESIFTQGYFEKFFNKVGTLGSGASGKVLKVEHVLQNCFLGVYALKKMPIGDNLDYLRKALLEVTILYKLQHSNLIRYNHVWLEMDKLVDDDSNDGVRFSIDASESDSEVLIPYVFILQQYCDGGNLEELIRLKFLSLRQPDIKDAAYGERLRRRKSRALRKGGKPIEGGSEIDKCEWMHPLIAWKFFKDIVQGVDYLHKQHILHRDLKPSNCLLDKNYDDTIAYSFNYHHISASNLDSDLSELPNILVSDFGEGQFEGSSRRGNGNTGTLEYTAPELLTFDQNGKFKEFNRKTDVYSLGMIFAWLCFGNLPFNEQNSISEGDIDVMRSKILGYDLEANIKGWFHNNNDYLKNPFPDSFMNLIMKMSHPNPLHRLSTGEILKELNLIRTQDLSITKDSSPFDHTHHKIDEVYSLNSDGNKSSSSDDIAIRDLDSSNKSLVSFDYSSSNSVRFLIIKYVTQHFDFIIKLICLTINLVALNSLGNMDSVLYSSLLSYDSHVKLLLLFVFISGSSLQLSGRCNLLNTSLIMIYRLTLCFQ